jgi:hypothetical protein
MRFFWHHGQRDDDRADECQAEAGNGQHDMPARAAETLVQEQNADQDPDQRVRYRDGRDRRCEASCSERDLLQNEPEHTGDG